MKRSRVNFIIFGAMTLLFAIAMTSCQGGTTIAIDPDNPYKPTSNNPVKTVKISGILQVGETLTATACDADGSEVSNAKYQWKRNKNSTSYDDIAGATEKTYTLTTADIGFWIRVYAENSVTKNNYTETYYAYATSTALVRPAESAITTLTADTWVGGQIITTATEQWYKFTATAATQYVHIDVGSLSNSLSVQLYDGSGSTIGSSSSFGNYDGYKTLQVVSGQTYYIRVWSSGTGTYKIAFNSILLPPGTITTATQLTANTWATGSIITTDTEDWYKFTATADKHYIHVKLGSLTAVYVQFYESSGSTLGSYITIGSYSTYATLDGVSGQTYYIKVYQNYYSNYTGTYQITFNTTTIAP